MKLKTMTLCAAMISIALSSVLTQAVTIDPSNPNIQYTGRWNFDNPSTPKVTWHGSQILLHFNGTDISVDIDAGARSPYGNQWSEQYRVIVDGVPSPDRIFMSSGRNIYTLASNLPAGDHTLVLFKETTYSYKSANTIYGFDINGTLLTPPARPPLRIEFFGDSNMDGTSNYSEQDGGNAGGYYAYPAMVSRMLGAEMNLQAVGGATLDKAGYGGDNDVRSFIFSENYIDQDTTYRSGFAPHVIVVNAGANDVGAGKAEIKNRYKDVINDLRTVYGSSTHIVLMNAYGWDLNEPSQYSDEVVAEVGGNLSTLKFPWLWEQFHGSMWDHSGQAHMLAQHIASLNPAWSIKNPNDIVAGFVDNGQFSNGSFEHVAPFGGYGWRYFTDAGVERVYDPAGAADGDYYLRLSGNKPVHQPIDATGDLLPGATNGGETYTVTAKIRGAVSGAQAKIETHFQGQQLWTHTTENGSPYPYQSSTFNVTTQWREYSHTFTAEAGVWTLFNYLIASSGTVEFDDIQISMGTGQPPGNQVPTANFNVSTSNLTADFSNTSTDSDGSIVSYSWDFGDGNSSNSANPSHSYNAAGTYTVNLTVTDDDGASDSTSQPITVIDATGGHEINLTIASATLTRGRLRVTLNWDGATGNNVEVFRDNNSIWVTANDGSYNASANKQTATSYVYQVCETDGSVFSEAITVNF